MDGLGTHQIIRSSTTRAKQESAHVRKFGEACEEAGSMAEKAGARKRRSHAPNDGLDGAYEVLTARNSRWSLSRRTTCIQESRGPPRQSRIVASTRSLLMSMKRCGDPETQPTAPCLIRHARTGQQIRLI